MDFPELKPKTKHELTRYLTLLNSVRSVEDARQNLPSHLTAYIELQINSGHGSFEEIIRDIKQYLRSLKDIKVYLAFEPTEIFEKKLIEYFEANIPSRYIELFVEPKMIGGVKVVIDGKLFDESLDSRIDLALQSHIEKQ